MGTLLDALTQDEPRQPARGGQGGEAAALRQRPVRRRDAAADRAHLPRRPSVRPQHDRIDGGPRRRHSGGRAQLLRHPLPAQQRRPDAGRRRRSGDGVRQGGHLLRRSGRRARNRPIRTRPRCRRWSSDPRQETVGRRTGARRLPHLAAAGRRARAEFDALDLAFTVLGSGQTSRLHRALVRKAEVAEAAAASTMGLIGGTSFGYAYARARDQVIARAAGGGADHRGGPAGRRGTDRHRAAAGQGPVRAALAARAGPDRLPGRRLGRVRHAARRSASDQHAGRSRSPR